ncbi:alpha/beta hydrolase [Nocardia sp. CA-128927]|uniref:alpha/beta hydrolase n=1 Tax=Nocardia sp. CA-128927 TaxID=3239975 RepID=UPI003D983B02
MSEKMIAAGVAVAIGMAPACSTPMPAQPPAPVMSSHYLDQKIDWKPCFDPRDLPKGVPVGSGRLEYGSYVVPRDWLRPDTRDELTIAVSRLRPATGEPKGTLLTNPGGPGVPGRSMPLLFLRAARTTLLDNMEVIGVDVRGTGGSTNVSCGEYPDLALDPRDQSRGNLDLLRGSNDLHARFCQAKSGEFGQYITTEQTVRDFDLLRHLLGRQKVNWLGYSGGTWLGAYYATYFPNRVGRFVFDSVMDVTGSWEDDQLGAPAGFERRFRGDFTPWVARYDQQYRLGATSEAVRQSYEHVRAKLTEQPVRLPQGEPIDAMALDSTLIQAMYDKHYFPHAAEYLSALRAVVDRPAVDPGDPEIGTALAQLAELTPALRAILGRLIGGVAPFGVNLDSWMATQWSIKCNDTPAHGWDDNLAALQGLSSAYPLRGSHVLWPCSSWQRPQTRLETPTGQGIPPVLLVQSVNDPSTPRAGAERTHRTFANSRLLTVTEEGDHGIYANGNDCVDKIVESFLVDGVTPEQDLTCQGMPLPEPNRAER